MYQIFDPKAFANEQKIIKNIQRKAKGFAEGFIAEVERLPASQEQKIKCVKTFRDLLDRWI